MIDDALRHAMTMHNNNTIKENLLNGEEEENWSDYSEDFPSDEKSNSGESSGESQAEGSAQSSRESSEDMQNESVSVISNYFNYSS